MKKICFAAALLLLMFCFSVFPASAKEYQENGYEYSLYGKEAVIEKVPNVKGHIQVPEKLGGFKVTEIAGFAFSKNICESISIPNSVTVIEGQAFHKCRNLKKIKLPAKLSKISYYMFQDCVSLQEVTLGKSVKKIQTGAFYNCVKLQKINLPVSLKKIQSNAFYKCFKLTNVKFGNKLTSIGSRAFYKNYELKKITIPSSVTKVHENAFEKCDSLASVIFKGKKTKLAKGVFVDCTGLKKVKLPAKMKYIPEKTFYGCTNLKSVVLPKPVSFIKAKSFAGCESLKKIHLTNKVYAIGDGAFKYSGLKSIHLNKKVQFIGNSAFAGTNIKNLQMGENVLYIGNKVFASCTSLKTIYIPANVKGINANAFNDCSSLREIRVAAGNKNYCAKDGVLYNKSMTKLIQYPLHKTNRSFHVPSSVRTIRSNSFNDNNYLRNLTISAGAIGNYAFQGMTKLRTVRITQGTKKIGKEAFLGCRRLSRIDIADSVKTIGDYAFSETNIRVAYIPSGLVKMNANAFSRCDKLSAFTGGGGRFTVKDGVLYNGPMTRLMKYPPKKNTKSFTVPRSVKYVSSEAFDRVSHLTKLYFEKGIKSLPYNCIYKVKNLKSIVFASGTKLKNGEYAVGDCPKLAVIVGPSSYPIRRMAYYASATLITL